MASIISHVTIPLGMRLGFGGTQLSNRLIIFSCLAAMLPDIDVISFKLGIDYASQFGHRGFTHSITFSLFIGLIGLLFFRYLNCGRFVAFLVLTISTLSHAVLDAMTTGGHGVAFFWPLTDQRYFLPWRPIEVSPIGVANFISQRGISVLQSEFIWVWLPILTLGCLGFLLRRSLRNH